jgi:hypothetical protein
VLEAVENLSTTPGLAEGDSGAKAVAARLLPALAALVAAARGDADTRFRGLKLLYDIIALFIGDYDDGAAKLSLQLCVHIQTEHPVRFYQRAVVSQAPLALM